MHGSWGSGQLLQTTLFTVLITDDGRVYRRRGRRRNGCCVAATAGRATAPRPVTLADRDAPG